jgi:hypothetical protein
MRLRQRTSRLTEHFSSLFATLAAAVLALGVSAPTTGDDRSKVDRLNALRVAEGILVEPDVGELEPPSIADENDEPEDDGDDEGDGYRAPVVIAPEVPVDAVPRGYETRQEELERPGARQDEVERGGDRQQDLELPDGPGIKY